MSQSQAVLGWGIIGIGRHAHRFMAPAIEKSNSGRLLAVYSRDMQRAKEFAGQHGNPLAYDSLDALLASKDIDAVYIGSPNNVHREQVLLAARAGKHILCDKPLATNVEDALVMVDVCKKAGVKLGVGFHLRHNPVHVKAREMVMSGIAGELLLVEIQYMHVTAGEERVRPSASWRQDPGAAGGGNFIGTGVHAIDLLRFVLGREVTHLIAIADNSCNLTGVERLIQSSMLLEGNIVTSLSAGVMKYPTNQLVIYGTEATIRCVGSLGYHGGGRLEVVSDKGVQTTEFPRSDVYIREVDSFADSIRLGTEPNASGYDGLKAVEVTIGVYDSLRKKTLINLHIYKLAL